MTQSERQEILDPRADEPLAFPEAQPQTLPSPLVEVLEQSHLLRQRKKHPLRRTSCLRENHEVIGVANEQQATPFQLLVQIIQQDVGQKR